MAPFPPTSRPGQLRQELSRGLLRAGNALRRWGLPLRPRAYLVYHPDYVTTIREGAARHSFDNRRPRRIIDQLERARAVPLGAVLTPKPASRDELLLVHTRQFLDEISDPASLAKLFFLEPELLPPREPLGGFLLQTGGTVLAASTALERGVPAINLGGGFHHAQRDRAEGFCPVNDVAVAIRALQSQGRLRRTLVVDLDYHQGNGTGLIFSQDEDVFTLSVHGQSWTEVPHKRHNLDVELPPGTGDALYLRTVRRSLAYALERFTPDLAIYLAGADPFAGDALGDFAVSEDGMLERDIMVSEVLAGAGVPMAVVLAGGYGQMAWTIAYNYAFWLLTGLRISEEYRPGNIRAAYRRVAARLTRDELRKGASDELEAESAEDLLFSRCGQQLFLDFYTCEGLQTALERYGFLDLLREKGFTELRFYLDASDPQRQIFRIYFDRIAKDHLLVELVARYRTLVTPPGAVADGAEPDYRMLSIEWLLMQDPTANFTLERQKLPGQQYPGLGVGRWTVELLRLMAERLECTGLMNIPQHYHNAYLYSKQMLCFYPEDQGRLEAMKRDLAGLPLVETSLALDNGKLLDLNRGQRVVWEGKPQVMPVQAQLNRYFARPGYIEAVAQTREQARYRLVEP